MRRLSIAVFILLLLISPVVMAEEATPLPIEIEVHQLINEERLDESKHGIALNPLELQSDLISIARSHSKDMAERGYFAHEDPEGNDVFDRLQQEGITYDAAGENLFTATKQGDIGEMAQDAVEGWIKSPGHYANILTEYAYTGIGYYEKEGQYFLTQIFLSADRSHLQSKGIIYDNENLESLEEEEPTFFEKYLSRNTIIIIIILLVILVGWDAQRRNRTYSRSRRRSQRYRL